MLVVVDELSLFELAESAESDEFDESDESDESDEESLFELVLVFAGSALPYPSLYQPPPFRTKEERDTLRAISLPPHFSQGGASAS